MGFTRWRNCAHTRFIRDWRISTAQRIKGSTLRFQKYKRRSEHWDHEHCVGCCEKFMETKVSPDVLTEGYVTRTITGSALNALAICVRLWSGSWRRDEHCNTNNQRFICRADRGALHLNS